MSGTAGKLIVHRIFQRPFNRGEVLFVQAKELLVSGAAYADLKNPLFLLLVELSCVEKSDGIAFFHVHVGL